MLQNKHETLHALILLMDLSVLTSQAYLLVKNEMFKIPLFLARKEPENPRLFTAKPFHFS